MATVHDGLCPRCNIPLSGLEHQGTVPLVCPSCRGLFLKGEDLARHFGSAVEVLVKATAAYAPYSENLPCPKGCGDTLPRCVTGALRPLIVDVCPYCKGTWFDGGEVKAVFEAARAQKARARSRRGPRPVPPDPMVLAQEEVKKVGAQQATDEDDAPGGAGTWLVQFVTGLPIEGYNPLFRFPISTWILILLCGGVFLLELTVDRSLIIQYSAVPTKVLEGDRVVARVFGSMFMHINVVHLLGNMYFLKIFGDNVEDRLGRIWFILFYLVCGVGAVFAHVLAESTSTLPMLGASGAIGGILAAYMFYFPDARITIAPLLITFFRRFTIRAVFYFPFWFAWQFLAVFLGGEGVAWWAHIGGFVAGFLLAWVLHALVSDRRVAAAAARMAQP